MEATPDLTSEVNRRHLTMHLQAPDPHDEDLRISMSPALHVTETQRPDNPLDDVFETVPAQRTEAAHTSPGLDAPLEHPSDMARLQQEHETAGYREGLTAAKATSIQAGFDEGFSLGAAIGMKAGELLGILEGIAGGAATSTAARELLAEAKRELTTRSIFGAEYWATDGTWRYQVATGGGEDIVFADVAKSHPLIQKWAKVVDEEIQRWGVDMAVLNSGGLEEPQHEGNKGSATSQQTSSRGPDALEW